MGLVNVRELLAFPAGDNSSDTLISGIHWNLTTLNTNNYTYYSNGTISNGSLCFLLFEPYTPLLLQNGTFLNSTSCYSPIRPIGARAGASLAFASFFFLSIMFTFINLRKHGRLFLPLEKRFRAIGRRWQWYWMLVVAALATVSGITSVDVDRYYLPELPLVLSNFFWFMMLPTTTAVVWESVRHWGSWQERQVVDPNPFAMRQDDRRSTVEFYLPLVFYLFFWLNIFMVMPRSWTALEKQRDPDQARARAEPVATDGRFKTAAFLLFCAWLVVVFSLYHSIKHYKPRNRGITNRMFGMLNHTPTKFLITIPLSLIMIGYEAAAAFNFSISPLNYTPNLPVVFLLGWLPIALILLVYQIAGYFDPNEDRDLIRQRRIRGAEADVEIGIPKKPHWWTRLHGNNQPVNVHDAIAQNVSEIGGGRATQRNLESNIEMKNMPGPKPKASGLTADATSVLTRPEGPEAISFEASSLFSGGESNPFPKRSTDDNLAAWGKHIDNANPGPNSAGRNADFSSRSGSTSSSATLGANSQKVRSMLDV